MICDIIVHSLLVMAMMTTKITFNRMVYHLDDTIDLELFMGNYHAAMRE